MMWDQVIAAAQGGKHSEKRESFGETLIIDPWGTVIGRLPGKKYCLHIEWLWLCIRPLLYDSTLGSSNSHI